MHPLLQWPYFAKVGHFEREREKVGRLDPSLNLSLEGETGECFFGDGSCPDLGRHLSLLHLHLGLSLACLSGPALNQHLNQDLCSFRGQ